MKMHWAGLVVMPVALATLACAVTVPFPPTDVKVGPTETTQIVVEKVGAPGETARLELGMGAGELFLRPGESDMLLTGTATYNIADFEPDVEIDGPRVSVDQGDLELEGIPDLRGDEVLNRWDLQLGGQPVDLRIHAGAYKADLELGGIRLSGLSITDGAADVRLAFTSPNPTELETFRYATGASQVRMEGLGNANFSSMRFEGGAGSFVLEFGGELRRDAEVRIDTGLSSVEILVPAGVPARAVVQGELSEVKVDGQWSGSGPEYTHPGEGPALTVFINSSLGSVRLATD